MTTVTAKRRRFDRWTALAVAGLMGATGLVMGPARAELPGLPVAPGASWASCGAKAEATSRCTTLQVPLDWNDPTGPKTSLAVALHPAADPLHKLGTLFFIPGAGVSTVNMVSTPSSFGGLLKSTPQLIALFDVVGMDVRGGGVDLSAGASDADFHSPPLVCDLPLHDPATSRFPTDEAGFDRLLERNRAESDSCVSGSGQLAAHMDAVTLARDAEAVRKAVGVEQWSWFAWTYVSGVAQTYANLFPSRLRAMVIDSPIDQSTPMGQFVREQAAAVEEGFERFARWCETTPACSLFGQDVRATYDSVLARAEQAPLHNTGASGPVTAEEVTFYTMYLLEVGHLYAPVGGWFSLADAIKAAAQGDGTLMAKAYAGTFGPQYYNPYRAVGCMAYSPQLSGYREFRDRMAAVRTLAPRMRGVSDAWDYMSGCLKWRFKPVNPQLAAPVTGAPPILLVAAQHNPLAPYAHAARVARQIKGSVVLPFGGDAHISYINSKCVGTLEAHYLITLQTPPPGTTCPDGT